MAQATRLFSPQLIEYAGFNNGIDLRTSPEAIPKDALVDATNMEYDAESGLFRTAWGVEQIHTAGATMDNTTRGYVFNGNLLYNCQQDLYRLPLATITAGATMVGSLTGTNAPSFTLFKDNCLIASGGQLQRLSASWTIGTLTASATACDKVWSRFGRVCTVAAGDDYINYSGLYDETAWDLATEPAKDWTSAGDLDPAYIEVGLGDGCDIVGVSFLGPDVLIFKRGTLNENITKLYRVIGEPFDWQIPQAANNIDCKNLWSVTNFSNEVWVLGRNGLKGIQTVADYGDVKQNEAGEKINATLAMNTDEYAKVWTVNARKQVWIKSQNDNRVWLFHPLQYSPVTQTRGAFTIYNFGFNVHDVVESGDNIYILGNDRIYKYTKTVAPPRYSFETGSNVLLNPYVLDRVKATGSGFLTGSAVIYIGGCNVPVSYGSSEDYLYDDSEYVFDDTDILGAVSTFSIDKRRTKRVNQFTVRVQGTGSAGFRMIVIIVGEG